MIVHIVSWKLKEDNKAENALHTKMLLESLIGKIEEIQTLEVGINSPGTSVSNWDVVLYSTFNTIDDLNKYQEHPLHKQVAEVIGTYRLERSCVDYER